MLSLFLSKNKFTIIAAIGGLLMGFGAGSWVQFKVKEAAFAKLTEQALKIQTSLQEDADEARIRLNNLTLELEVSNAKLQTVQQALSLVGNELGSANKRLRDSATDFASRLTAATTSCVERQSVANIVAALRNSVAESERCAREHEQTVKNFGSCAKDAGQCGADRAALLYQSWSNYETTSGASK